MNIAIKTLSSLEKISDDWIQLAKSVNASPFQFPHWIIPWWQYYGEGDMKCFTVYEDNKLKFFAPVFIRRLKSEPEAKMVFIGTGNTDYLDVLCSKENSECMNLFFEFLYSLRNEYDVIDLQEINENSLLLSSTIPEYFTADVQPMEVCHKVKLPSSYEEFLNSFSKNRVKNLLRIEKKLASDEGFSFEAAGPDELEYYLTESAELNNLRWNSGVLDSEDVRNFNTSALTGLMKDNMAGLYRLRNGNNTIAVEYILFNNGVAYDYIHSNNPAYAKYSPGFLMRIKSIEHLISRGFREFDFLRGDEDYKKDWETYKEQNYRFILKPAR